MKGVGKRRTQLLDYSRSRRYWGLKEEAEDGNDSLCNFSSLKRRTITKRKQGQPRNFHGRDEGVIPKV